jgi:hypothetical protein
MVRPDATRVRPKFPHNVEKYGPPIASFLLKLRRKSPCIGDINSGAAVWPRQNNTKTKNHSKDGLDR